MAELRFSYLDPNTDRSDTRRKWLLHAIVGVVFIFIGESKFEAHSQWVGLFQHLGFGQWLRYFTGVLQVGGGLLLLIPRTFVIGIAMLALTMLGAMAAWIFFLGGPVTAVIPGAILGGLLAVGGEDLTEFASSCRKQWLKPR